ncbi:MAG: carbohydrate-binding domain-containing protein, partial [Oscillibacter sp.]|nr:carbohydrate-binding domain-containing protein [Oscillibacter sp.]
MKKLYRRAGAVLTALALLLTLLPLRAAADDESAPTASATFTFTDSGVTASDSAYDDWISGTALTISAAGTYAVTGTCSEGSVTVARGLTGVVLVLDALTLSCSTSAPLLCKKSTGVTLWLSGASTLTDNENPDDETSEDATVADAFEGAAVKVNSDGAALTIRGTGSLTADGSACKNGIKAGATSTITVSGGTLNITAVNNGLAADGAVIIKGGTLNVTATNDGIKASPDEDDTESAGTITIYGGEMNINAQSDGIKATGDITIYGGTFNINAQSDGIQTDSNLTISDGVFDITTLNGYNSSSFDSDTMSCKGLKASAGSDDSDDDTDTATNTLTITGGTFTLNTADDAIHSDAYIEITGGTFTIDTGDDGAHADTSLILGTNGGTVARDPDMTINNSYEGLEAGTVYVYSGRYHVRASDDGINSAGGTSDGTDPGGGGGNNFNPGGGGPGGRLMSMDAPGERGF